MVPMWKTPPDSQEGEGKGKPISRTVLGKAPRPVVPDEIGYYANQSGIQVAGKRVIIANPLLLSECDSVSSTFATMY